ncbi:hypothetical protein [Aeromicrobium erythreum]|uniref:Uncharacterized protein n=1 Tax=Aeromicrobium erythreum TaxID=2041 RepID=A0A0U3T462_9ACTN|nr:hypothetical protein [Aeromicrobium erythreum]ALX05498.1 hypothetical protein AERYTH_12730 [Aeromicrobium erythreum]
MSEHRMAWLVTTDDAVAVGDPWRDHVLLTTEGLVHRRLDVDAEAMVDEATWSWADVTDLLVSAPTSRTSKPGLWAFLRAAAAEATGWGSTLSSVEVAVRIVHADGTDALLLLDGHTGGGYPAEDQEEAHAMLRRVLEDPGTLPQIRNLIAQPDA